MLRTRSPVQCRHDPSEAWVWKEQSHNKKAHQVACFKYSHWIPEPEDSHLTCAKWPCKYKEQFKRKVTDVAQKISWLVFYLSLDRGMAVVWSGLLWAFRKGGCKHNSFILQLAEFQPLVEEPKNLVKTNCDLYEKLGEYGFQNAWVVLSASFFFLDQFVII